jgi:hypothetical protein
MFCKRCFIVHARITVKRVLIISPDYDKWLHSDKPWRVYEKGSADPYNGNPHFSGVRGARGSGGKNRANQHRGMLDLIATREGKFYPQKHRRHG